jgi:glycosyltransferase involved in cell wall biosynthesis
MAKILVAYADYGTELATSRFRCFTPARALVAAGHSVVLMHISKVPRMNLIGFDAVLAERTLTTGIIKHIRKFKCKLVFTFDDAYTELPGYAHVLDYWRRLGGVKEFRKVLKLTDLNITPSMRLNDLYAKGNAPFEYVPNFLDRLMWDTRFDRFEREEGDGSIVLGGGFSAFHRDSFMRSGISDALKKTVGDRIRLQLYGDISVFAPLQVRGVPFENQGFVNWTEWPSVMSSFDIAIAPSAGRYDLYRSNLRLLEAGAARTPFIASKHGPYNDAAPGGLIVNNDKREWIDAIRYLSESESERDWLGDGGYEWASKYFMDDNVDVYERILLG